MNFTPEQFAQCRKEFEDDYSERYPILSLSFMSYQTRIALEDRMEEQWIGFQAAWRPRLTVMEIEDIVQQASNTWNMGGFAELIDRNTFISKAVYRALVGQDE